MLKACVLLFLVIACGLLFLQYDSSSYESSIEKIKKEDEVSTVENCLPNQKFLQKVFEEGNSDRKQKRTFLLLSSAYDYPDYITVTLQSEGFYGQAVYCRYLNKNLEEIGKPILSKVFPEWTVMCCKRENAAYMSITINPNDPLDQYTKLLDRKPNSFKYDLSLCLSPMYGNETKWLLLAETIEHYKLQHVDHFYLYIKDVDDYSRQLIDHYVSTGIAEAIYLEHRQDRAGREWQLMAVQECLHRSRYESRYSIFCDIDERITPSTNENLSQMTRKHMQDKNIGIIQFRPRWILRDKPLPQIYEGSETVHKNLPTFIFHNTTFWPSPGHTAKCILDPLKVFIMWVHWPMKMYPGFNMFAVPPETAVVRHYRDVYAGNWGQVWLPGILRFGNLSYTEYPPSLMVRLMKNVQTRLDLTYNNTLS